ncbi:pimeloyl-ACP methyl ester carboxylesterase [Rhodovulum imhoffii]|uniref:Pimeloyl-ACP methyl ester carboxylesterase n=1 Tax=Rhodovulum imhoffii TaxID=365340 RepID=A0A2T5BNI3_9RHOB|nr:alpha/beta hydrolase [Rhodovulum imhoffii]MBK5934620.1 alpha/beta hydrolase [Rhodovulum imhoffii]PTN00552.1 pimeloyl-ACP methyl ester carboxylesterase [Rhodovulum imhoffii]
MPHRYPPEGTLLHIGGTQVHAVTRGAGPDLILLHGAGGNSRDFTFDLMGRLTSGFRVTAFDRPGHGHTDTLHPNGESPFEQAMVLEAAAVRLGLGRTVLVGHSFGGAVALAWALGNPTRVAAVVSLAGAAMPWPGGLGPYYTIASSRIGGALLIPLISAFAPGILARRTIETIFAPDPVPDGYIDHIGIALSLRPESLRANTRQVNGLKPHIRRMAARYDTLKMPIEILHGTADVIVPIQIHARPFAAQIPQASLTELPGIGHMPHHARPEAALEAIHRAATRAGLH